MTNQITMALPPPMLWQDFEQLTWDKAKFTLNADNAQRYGNQGSAQNGVDIFCTDPQDKLIGIQCKRKGTIDAQGRAAPGGLRLQDLVNEAKAAESYPNRLDHYIIATTQPRQTRLQDEAQRLSKANRARGLFSVQIWFWDDFISALHRSSEMLSYYYSNVLEMKGAYSSDHQILYLLQMAFSRPAFNIRLCNEDTGTGLQDALRDTEAAFTTGQLRDRMTSSPIQIAPGGLSMISDLLWQAQAKLALGFVREARAELKDAVDGARIFITPKSMVVADYQSAAKIDQLRKDAVDALNIALISAGMTEVDTDL